MITLEQFQEKRKHDSKEEIMEKNRKFSWIRKVLIGLAISIMIAAGVFFWYVNDYYQATVEAVEALQSDESITVTETDDTITFTPNGKDPEEGVFFYPGGKVEAEAYAPLLRSLAEADLLWSSPRCRSIWRFLTRTRPKQSWNRKLVCSIGILPVILWAASWLPVLRPTNLMKSPA